MNNISGTSMTMIIIRIGEGREGGEEEKGGGGGGVLLLFQGKDSGSLNGNPSVYIWPYKQTQFHLDQFWHKSVKMNTFFL